MGTGWRRAFCTTIPRDRREVNKVVDKHEHPQEQREQQQNSPSPSPRSCYKLGFLSSGSSSTPCTPRVQTSQQQQQHRLRCRTQTPSSNDPTSTLISPKLHCKTTPKKSSAAKLLGSNPSSPRSPFSILKNSLRLYKNSCGVCMQSVKTGQGMAIYTAECSHTFHFPCIASHVKKQSALTCPVCNSTWKDVPLLAIHQLQHQQQETAQPPIQEKKVVLQLQEDPKPSPRLTKQYSIPPPQVQLRQYDDDEPLVTPRAGGAFVPIPEVDDVDEEEVEEFKGFFVNPISSDEGNLVNSKDTRSVEVSLMPEAAIVSMTRTHQTYAVVLKVKAPRPAQNSGTAHVLDPGRRAPIDLVTVLDVSGSMSGAKLQMLKRAMRLVISSLGSADRLSIVAFSACPKRLMPLRRMTTNGQRSARRIIDRLVCSQGTSVGEALKKAAKVLEDRRERNPVASIILLSDGQDETVQPTSNSNKRQGSCHGTSTRFAHVEIPVHSSGFGQRAAGYGQEPAEDAFSKCVGGLLSVVVQELKVELGFSPGSDPGEISAVYSCNGRPTVLSTSCVRLGDLYAEEEREVLIELRVPATAAGSHHVLSVRCCYKDPATQELVNGREHALLVPRAQAVRTTLPRIERLRNVFITTRAIAESRRLIEHNELSSAMQLLSSARSLLLQSSPVSGEEFIRGLEAEIAEVDWRRKYQEQMIQRRRMSEKEMGLFYDENGEPLTPTSAWRAAEKLAKVATMKKSLNRVSDLHGFENARF